MLNKLIKYEFLSVAKVYFTIYGLILLLAALNRGLFVASLPQELAITIYAILITIQIVLTVAMGIERFKKNLLNDEGYLMFTLPVARWQLILSKIISAVVWTILSGIVSIMSIIIMLWPLREMFKIAMQSREMLQVVTLLFVAIILAIVLFYLSTYLAMSIGYTVANKNKDLWSVIIFFVISYVCQNVISKIWGNVWLGYLKNAGMEQKPFYILATAIILLVVLDAIFFFGTNYMLKNKLNLE